MAERDPISRTSSATAASGTPGHQQQASQPSSTSLDKQGYTPGEEKTNALAAPIPYGEDVDDEDENVQMMKAVATGDQFPEMPGAVEETEFTFRGLIVGCFCGALIGASDLYLGLKTSNSIGGDIFGSIAGFGILVVLTRVLPMISGSEVSEHTGPVTFSTRVRRFFKLGGLFGPKENVVVMACAKAAASNGVAFYSIVPAMFSLKLVEGDPHSNFGKLVALSAVCAYWGMFLAVPFRRLYVIDMALPFPTAVATSITIRTLHTPKGAADNARRMRVLLGAAFFAFAYRVVSQYAPGILFSHHIFWAFFKAGAKHAIEGENWGWYLTWSPAYLGVGMIIGLNGSASILAGQVLAWGIVGPALVASKAAAGQVVSAKLFPGYTTYSGVTPPMGPLPPSPRYWLLWPGILLLMVSTFTEVAMNGKAMAKSLLFAAKRYTVGTKNMDQSDVKVDPVPASERIHWWLWLPAAVVVGIFTAVVMSVTFHQRVEDSVLAIFLAIVLAFVTCESVGRLSISGISGPITQVIFLAYTHARGYPVMQATFSNALAGTLTVAASQQIGDMVGDLKSAHLMRASPRMMFWAQAVGALIATVLSPGLFLLFTDAYPCIISTAPTAYVTCNFPAPSAVAYRGVVALSARKIEIPVGSGVFAILLSVFAIAVIVYRTYWMPLKYRKYVPSFLAIAIGIMLPTPSVGIAFFFGGLTASLWAWRNPASAAIFLFPVAAGFVAGEGIGGILNAVLQMGNVGGQTKGSTVGCPFNLYAIC